MELCTELSAVVSIVDEFAAIRSEIADLEAREDALKAMLVATGEKRLIGTQHKVSVAWVCPKPMTDFKAVVEYLRVGEETLSMFEKSRDPYVTVKVLGR